MLGVELALFQTRFEISQYMQLLRDMLSLYKMLRFHHAFRVPTNLRPPWGRLPHDAIYYINAVHKGYESDDNIVEECVVMKMHVGSNVMDVASYYSYPQLSADPCGQAAWPRQCHMFSSTPESVVSKLHQYTIC